MGTMFQGFGEAAQSAQGSLAWSALGTGLGAAKDVATGVGAAQRYAYMAQVNANNATITRQNADAALAAGGYAESVVKMRTTLEADQGVSKAASNGIDVGLGAPQAVKDSTLSVGALDAAVAHFNAARTAYGLDAEASNLDTEANLYRSAASNTKAAIIPALASTLIGGATSISGKLSAYKQSGALAAKDSNKGLY